MRREIDLIVPTVPGREESLERCLASFPGLNHIVVSGYPACGQAWEAGIRVSDAPYLMLCADDIEAMDSDWIEPCVEAVDEDLLPAPMVFRPDGSIESAGGDMAASGCLLTDVRPNRQPVDFTPMPFLSRAQIESIGMIPSHMMCDVWVSHRGRQLGYETVLLHDYRLVHHHEMVGRKSATGPDDQRIYQHAIGKATSK